jgi:hypothetical protein
MRGLAGQFDQFLQVGPHAPDEVVAQVQGAADVYDLGADVVALGLKVLEHVVLDGQGLQDPVDGAGREPHRLRQFPDAQGAVGRDDGVDDVEGSLDTLDILAHEA